MKNLRPVWLAVGWGLVAAIIWLSLTPSPPKVDFEQSDKVGHFIKNIEAPWKPYTPPPDGKPKESGGSAVALDFSRDPAQRYLYLINQNNSQIEVLERETGKKLSSFGRVGRYPGEFDQAHGIAVDSKSNVYIAENRGRKIQRFKPVMQ